MAINSIMTRKNISLKFRYGTDTKGTVIYRTVGLNGVNTEVSDEDVFNILYAINAVMDENYDAKEFIKDEKSSIMRQS